MSREIGDCENRVCRVCLGCMPLYGEGSADIVFDIPAIQQFIYQGLFMVLTWIITLLVFLSIRYLREVLFHFRGRGCNLKETVLKYTTLIERELITCLVFRDFSRLL
jgi:hypothetical protein